MEQEGSDLRLATHNGFYRYSVSQNKLFPINYEIKKPPVVRKDLFTKLVSDSTGFWLGAWKGGLSHYNPVGKKWSNFPGGSSPIIILDLLQKDEDELWVASETKGLGTFNTVSKKFEFSTDASISANCSKLFKDRTGVLWVGTYYGLVKVDPYKNQFRYTPGPANSSCFYFDREDSLLFVGSYYEDGLHIFDFKNGAQHGRELNQSKTLGNMLNSVSCIFKDSRNTLWVLSDEHIFQFDRKKKILTDFVQPKFDSLSGVPIYNEVIEDRHGDLWFTTAAWGVIKYSGKTNTFQNVRFGSLQEKNYRENYITHILEDKSGNIWVGSLTGVHLYSEATHELLATKNTTGSVSGIVQTENGSVWISTKGEGIKQVRLNNGKIEFQNLDGLESTYVMSLRVDHDQNLWFTYKNGIGKYNLGDSTVTVFYIANDLVVPFNLSPLNEDGKFYIGGGNSVGRGNGYYSFDPKQTEINTLPPLVGINSFRVRNENFKLPSGKAAHADDKTSDLKNSATEPPEIKLNYDQDAFNFEIVGLSFGDPKRNQYAYRLVGYEDNWIYSGTYNYGSFSNLPYGTPLLFQVKASNEHGVWSTPLSYTILVKPPYWRTWWFFSIATVLALAVISGAFYYQVNQVRKKEREKAAVARKIMEMKMKALRAQMNPHFIFNSLNSIQFLIAKKDTDEAFDYLSKFSVLLRSILEASERTYISVKEEIDVLKVYLELESLLYDGNFSFEIKNSIADARNILIPQLVIQPIVENAIIHGLAPKKNDRNLLIAFTETDQKIICEIRDNGIGRKAAMINKQNKMSSHRSMGIGISEERLNIQNNVGESDHSITITDLYDENGNAAGTSVIVILARLD